MSNTVALITGAAKRIGREMALHLADQGWDIAVHYHRSEREAEALKGEIEAKGANALLLPLDLQQTERAGELVEAAVHAFGRLDALIHNASAFEKDSLETLTPDSWRRHQSVNLEAALFLSQAFQRAVNGSRATAHAPRNIIFLLDGCEGWGISEHFFSYAMSKKGLENAMELLASALAPDIRVNGMALGPTLAGTKDKPETFETLKARSLLKRTTDIKDVLRTLDFILLSPVMTGQVIDLSGGLRASHGA